MALDPVTAVLDIGGKLIDKLWPDPAQRDAAKYELFKLQQSGELAQLTAETELAKGQIDVNKQEAQNSSVFVSGWRPGAGWVCVVGLGYTFLAQPLFAWLSLTKGWPTPPNINTTDLMVLLTGMLGLGGLRSFDKVKGVAT